MDLSRVRGASPTCFALFLFSAIPSASSTSSSPLRTCALVLSPTSPCHSLHQGRCFYGLTSRIYCSTYHPSLSIHTIMHRPLLLVTKSRLPVGLACWDVSRSPRWSAHMATSFPHSSRQPRLVAWEILLRRASVAHAALPGLLGEDESWSLTLAHHRF